jgi:hypothetical protein
MKQLDQAISSTLFMINFPTVISKLTSTSALLAGSKGKSRIPTTKK